jgi:hypothetical protein
VNPLFQERETFTQVRRRFRLQDQLNFLSKIGDFIHSQRHGDALARAHRVNGNRKGRWLSINDRLLK